MASVLDSLGKKGQEVSESVLVRGGEASRLHVLLGGC